MGYGDPASEMIFAKLFNPRCVREVYKRPQEQIDGAIEIYERNTKCKSCEKKALKVTSFEECKATCTECGTEQ